MSCTVFHSLAFAGVYCVALTSGACSTWGVRRGVCFPLFQHTQQRDPVLFLEGAQ